MNKSIIKKVSCMTLAGIMLLSGQALGNYSREEVKSEIQLSKTSSLLVDKVLGYGSNYDLRQYKYIYNLEEIGNTNAGWAIAAAKFLEYSSEYFPELSAKHMDFSTANDSTTTKNENAHSRGLGDGGSIPVALGYFTSGRGPIARSEFEWNLNGYFNKVSLSKLQEDKPNTIVESYKIFPSMYKMTYDNGQGGKITFAYNDPIIYTSVENAEDFENLPEGVYEPGTLSAPTGTTFSATKDMVSYTGGEVEQVRDEIKRHIIEYGPVSAKIYRDPLNMTSIKKIKYSNSELECVGDGDSCTDAVVTYTWHENEFLKTPLYYCNEKLMTPTSDVIIIGWDDEIEIPGAPGRGAYLVMDPTPYTKKTYKLGVYGPYASEAAARKDYKYADYYFEDNGQWYYAFRKVYSSGYRRYNEVMNMSTNYYYVSYYDYYIESQVYGIKETTSQQYQKTYQHDPLGLSSSVNSLNYSTIAYGANVWDRTQGKEEVVPELLGAISIASEADMQYEVYVNPKSGELTEDKLIKVATTDVLEAGYNTIYFDESVPLTGEKFAVAVKYIAANKTGGVTSVARIGVEAPTQMKYKMLANNKTETYWEDIKYWKDNARSYQKQSYIGTSLNDWNDLFFVEGTNNYNICIKAYVNEFANYKVPAEKIELKNMVEDAFGDIVEETLPETVKILKGDTITLGATVLPEDAADKSVSWTSSNKTVATVDKNGLVTTHAAGTATITARMTNTTSIYAECKIDVRVPVDSFVLNKSEVTILAGDTNVLAAIIGPEDATTTKVEWSSNNKEVVKVTEDGLLIGLKQGSAIVTAVLRDENGIHTATCKVTVPVSLVVNVTGVSLNKTSLQLTKGTRETLTATVTPGDATNTAVVWASSNKNVAIVNSNGRITAISPGTATITATTVSGGETATCTVTVVEEAVVKVTGVSLSASSVTLEQNKTRQLTAAVTPNNSANTKVVWSSNNLSVAEVDSNGKITAISPGTAVITATTADGGYTAKCTVTVTKPVVKVTDITINKTFVELDKGNTQQLVAGVTPSNADNTTINWTTSNDKIVTVDATGKITAVGYGDAVITATTADGGYTKKCKVTVPEVIPVTGIQISSNELTIENGITSKLEIKVLPTNATNSNISIEIEDETIATMAGDGVKALNIGQTTITFTTEDGEFTETCTVNVIEPTKDITISSDNYQVNEENQIYDVSGDTTAEEFKENITTNGTIVDIVDKNGDVIEDDKKVGTGSVITIEKEITTTPEEGGESTTTTVTEQYVVKIAGDLNGDGDVTITDFTRLRQYVFGELQLEEIELEAADLDGDEQISLIDLSILRSQIIEE